MEILAIRLPASVAMQYHRGEMEPTLVTHDNRSLIARYEKLRRQLVAIERAGQWNSAQALALDEELVELERLPPEDYGHEDDEWMR